MQATSAAPDDPFAAPTDPAAAAPAATTPATTPAPDPFGGADPFAQAAGAITPAGLSSQDWVIALGVVAAAAVLWYFVRRYVETMLARQHVAPDAAAGASWMLFGFLVVLTATVVFGIVGNLWSVTLFLWPALGLCLILLVLTLVMYTSAMNRRR